MDPRVGERAASKGELGCAVVVTAQKLCGRLMGRSLSLLCLCPSSSTLYFRSHKHGPS